VEDQAELLIGELIDLIEAQIKVLKESLEGQSAYLLQEDLDILLKKREYIYGFKQQED
tara:strand:+ start:1113 stop:1286 length:174 start_codon:yes stop_codon:yes gene_type:complete